MKKIWSFRKLEDGTREITSYKGDATEVEVPPRIGKTAVTKIGDEAFSSCAGLKSLMIPEGITSIGDEAFTFCGNLISVTIPESMKTIGGGAFNAAA